MKIKKKISANYYMVTIQVEEPFSSFCKTLTFQNNVPAGLYGERGWELAEVFGLTLVIVDFINIIFYLSICLIVRDS